MYVYGEGHLYFTVYIATCVHVVNDTLDLYPSSRAGLPVAIVVVITFFVTLVALVTVVIVLAIIYYFIKHKCSRSNSHKATVTTFNTTNVDLDSKGNVY